ncbi:MAG: hypothetical protein ACOCV1_04380 [Bacillota bacterium]
MTPEKDYVKRVVGRAVRQDVKNYPGSTVDKVLKGTSKSACDPCEKITKKYK